MKNNLTKMTLVSKDVVSKVQCQNCGYMTSSPFSRKCPVTKANCVWGQI